MKGKRKRTKEDRKGGKGLRTKIKKEKRKEKKKEKMDKKRRVVKER